MPAQATAPVPATQPNANIPDLWPDDIAAGGIIPPVSILRHQAQRLASKTNGLVHVTVESVIEKPQSFIHSFVLTAPSLGNYSARLFRVKHSVHFYPLEIITDVDGPNFRAGTQDDLCRALGEVFASAGVKKIVQSLLAQCRACEAGGIARAPAGKDNPTG